MIGNSFKTATLILLSTAIFASTIPALEQKYWSSFPLQEAISVPPLAKQTRSMVEFIQPVIKGQCYFGPGKEHPVSGRISFCFAPVNGTYFPFSSYDFDWEYSIYAAVNDNGSFVRWFNAISGPCYVGVYMPPYAIQWWNGEQFNQQPTSIMVSSDTLVGEFHFLAMGCSLNGRLEQSDGTTSYGRVHLIDSSGIILYTVNVKKGGYFQFQCIPVGSYYLKIDKWGHPTPYYPQNSTADDAYLFTFDSTGQHINNIVWTISTDTVSEKKHPVSKVSVLKPDEQSNLYALYRYIGFPSKIGLASTTTDSLTLSIRSNTRFFLLRANQFSPSYDIYDMELSYFPGTFIRSEAETLVVASDTTLMLQFAQGGRIQGTLPVFNSKKMMFMPTLTVPGSYKSLGALPYVDPNGRFAMSAPAGKYSLWCVPLTEGNVHERGWGAFNIENVVVTDNENVKLSQVNPLEHSASITGTVQCNGDPLLACFDSLGRCVSITTISKYEYFRDLTGNRWKSFDFLLIHSPPYSISYSLNSLPVGKYAVALIETPTDGGEYKISWYGGPISYQTFVEIDDVTLLAIPAYVKHVAITAPGQTANLGEFRTGILPKQPFKSSNARLRINQRTLRNLSILFSSRADLCNVKLVDARGKVLLNKYFVNAGPSINLSIPKTIASGLVLYTITVDEKQFHGTIVIPQ